MSRLYNKVAIVTGGGSGIGQAISLVFAQQGAKVFILDIDEAGAADTINQIKEKGGHGVLKKCSVAVKDEVDKAIQEIVAETNRLNIVVNNAGIAHVGNAETTTPEDLERLLSVNVK